MISIEEYRNIISELMDELPKEFFRDLSGGVIVSEALVIPDYARADAARAKELLRGILRHEFRHHLEFLGGIHNSDSLEAEDRRRKQAYLSGQ